MVSTPDLHRDAPRGDADTRDTVVHLDRGGTGLVLRLGDTDLPVVLHWGAPLTAPKDDAFADALLTALGKPVTDSAVTTQDAVSVLPRHSAGWLGRPGLEGSRAGRAWSVTFDSVVHHVEEAGGQAWPEGPVDAVRVRSHALDDKAQLAVSTELELLATGLVRLRAAVRNLGDADYEVTHLEPALPVPAQAAELLDFTGRHNHERTPQRRPFDVGAWVREARGGRPGHDAATVLAAGTPGFGFRTGRVWGVHVAWSGNQVTTAERTVSGWRLLRGGELLLPGETRLRRGEEYASPWLVASWGDGLDELSQRIHRHLRSRPQHPTRPRPVLLNTWEAVLFDHDLPHLLDLAEKAAAVGVERFVLDDGWFGRRRDDHRGLGDWVVAPDVWPDGLHPLVDRVHALGMEFGLWVEPEMVNLDSALAEAHPEWLFATDHGAGIPSRQQHVLDLGHPGAYAHVLGQLSALVAEYDIAYLKWDHNRALVDAGHTPGGEPGVHLQTLAVLRLMAELKDRHPGLEIESCAGGGARIDLGILDVTDRVWLSDCIDAHERHRIMRWTGLLLPPELMGTHVGNGVDHTTRRALTLPFRAATAIWGHLGIEWDLSAASPDELAELGRWVAFHKDVRGLLHGGVVVHGEVDDPALWLDGVVAPDGRDALFGLSALAFGLAWPPGRIRLPGLRHDLTYRVTVPDVAAEAVPPWARTRWFAGVTLPGDVLGEIGLQSPILTVDQSVLIRAQAV